MASGGHRGRADQDDQWRRGLSPRKPDNQETRDSDSSEEESPPWNVRNINWAKDNYKIPPIAASFLSSEVKRQRQRNSRKNRNKYFVPPEWQQPGYGASKNLGADNRQGQGASHQSARERQPEWRSRDDYNGNRRTPEKRQ